MILPKFIPLPKLCPWSAPVGVLEWFTNCDNQVAEIVGNWEERKYELWQPSCRKWKEKKKKKWLPKSREELKKKKKKKCYIHNIFTTFSQQITLVVISLNLNLTLRLFF